MKATTSNDKRIQDKSTVGTVGKNGSENASPSLFADNRAGAVKMHKMQAAANNSIQVKQLSAYQESAVNYSKQRPFQIKENKTGLPDNLKSGTESLSGYSMDDVKVHYNSHKPAQLHAHAYAQGTDIHLAPGQEKHLPHEAWHVVQQKQGRVKPTTQRKNRPTIDNDSILEKKSNFMSTQELQMRATERTLDAPSINSYKSSIYQLMGDDQKSVMDEGNRTPSAYQIEETDIPLASGHFKSWDGQIPTLNQFESSTAKFWALRSSDVVLTQIDTLLARFNQLRNIEGEEPTKKELIQEIYLACEFWLRKVNKTYTGKKPAAATPETTNLGGNTLKLKGEEERRAGILALSLACSTWLHHNSDGGTLEQIVNSRVLPNQGVSEEHGFKDVNTWDTRSEGAHIFPEPAHRADWNNSRAMNEDHDYVVLQNDDQKRTAKLVFRGGVAYRWKDILKPDSAFDIHTSRGEEHFVMDKRGRIYTGTLGILFFHSSLVGFADALAAGMMRVNNGKVVSISTDSGHYKPNIEAMVRVLRQLQRYGADASTIQVKRKGVPDLGDATFTGAQILASRHSQWPDQ